MSRASQCSSVMTRTTVVSEKPVKEAPAASNNEAVPSVPAETKAASVVSAAPSSRAGSKAVDVLSVARSKASTTTTVMVKQLQNLEAQLEQERQEREKASEDLKRTARELEALERVLKLKR
jgi:hypothetical protein